MVATLFRTYLLHSTYDRVVLFLVLLSIYFFVFLYFLKVHQVLYMGIRNEFRSSCYETIFNMVSCEEVKIYSFHKEGDRGKVC